MGLSKGEETRPGASPTRGWWVPATLAATALLLVLVAEPGREFLRFERSAIANGEIWRLLTGHLVHLGPTHAVLNVAGLLLVWYLVGRDLLERQWLWVIGASIVAIDAGLWFLNTRLDWYVGLSGILHGMLAAGVVAGFLAKRLESSIIGIIVGAKLAFEQLVGPLPGSESTSGGAVVVDAHLYGVVGGIVAAAVLIRVRREASI